MRIDVTYTPSEFESRDVTGKTVVAIDCFRASTSMIQALSSGAASVHPYLSVDEARSAASCGSAVLAGERGGARIEGFDLGNSPGEFTPEAVGGRDVIMTTTNGTRILAAASAAARILVACFVNATVTAGELMGYDSDVVLAAAGTQGGFAVEDALCAGLIVDILEKTGDIECDDSATFAALAYRSAAGNLRGAALSGVGAGNVLALGLAEDLDFALKIDSIPVVARALNDPLRIVRTAR